MPNVTFMIGNGFDIVCGLKSRYKDTYEEYVNTHKENESNAVKKFKKAIEKDIEYWGDFELALSRYAAQFQTEEEIIECIRDYKEHLNNHLQKEQELFWGKNEKIINSSNEITKEIGRSLTQFFMCLKPNDRDNILPCFDNQVVNYNFISFNYTNIFDNLIEATFEHEDVFSYVKKPIMETDTIHIHGKLGEDLILGLDAKKQISGIEYNLTDNGLLDLIKPYYLEQYNRNLLNDTRKKIFASDVICIFGLSLGDSDLSWRELLASWLRFDYSVHHLVYFSKDNMDKEYTPLLKPQMIVDENDSKNDFMRFLYGDSIDDITKIIVPNRIHFPVGSKIFDLTKYLF